jgi:hypothetical protein
LSICAAFRRSASLAVGAYGYPGPDLRRIGLRLYDLGEGQFDHRVVYRNLDLGGIRGS